MPVLKLQAFQCTALVSSTDLMKMVFFVAEDVVEGQLHRFSMHPKLQGGRLYGGWGGEMRYGISFNWVVVSFFFYFHPPPGEMIQFY